MKKIIVILILLSTVFAMIPVYAADNAYNSYENLMQYMEELIANSYREESYTAGNSLETLKEVQLPKISDEVVEKLTGEEMTKLNELLKPYEPFSSEELYDLYTELNSAYKHFNFRWNDLSNPTVVTSYPVNLEGVQVALDEISHNRGLISSAKEPGSPSAWAVDLVEDAIQKGYVPAHLQGNYQTPITREEFAELFVTAVFAEINADYALEGSGTKKVVGFDKLTADVFLEKVSTTESFTDTDNDYIKVANILGMVNGVGNNKFNPDGLITREQASIMFVNYLQTVYSPNGYDAYETLSDIEDASPWAEEAVAWAYGAGFLNGTKSFTHANGQITSLGYFDTKGNFTREQAIVVISRLGSGEGNKDILDNLILRGYMLIGLEALDNWEIDGDIIYFKSTGYDYKYSGIKEFFRTQTKLKTYAESVATEQIIAALTAPNGSQFERLDTYHIDRIIDGSSTLYDYGVFSIQHNTDGYLSIISKNQGYPYLSYAGGQLSYVKDGVRVVVTGEEVK